MTGRDGAGGVADGTGRDGAGVEADGTGQDGAGGRRRSPRRSSPAAGRPPSCPASGCTPGSSARWAAARPRTAPGGTVAPAPPPLRARTLPGSAESGRTPRAGPPPRCRVATVTYPGSSSEGRDPRARCARVAMVTCARPQRIRSPGPRRPPPLHSKGLRCQELSLATHSPGLPASGKARPETGSSGAGR